jgi:hypothetical protein
MLKCFNVLMIYMADTKQKTDDFFTLLKEDEGIENPFATDEIIIRDESGNLSVLKGGKVLGLEKPEKKVEDKVELKANEPKKAVADFQVEVENIIKKLGIHFSDQETEKRFRSAVLSRLKGVRNQVQTREILLNSPLVGGLGFKSEEADRILSVISKEASSLQGRLRESVSEEPFSDLREEVNAILGQAKPAPQKPEVIFSSPAPEIKEKPPTVIKMPSEKPEVKSFIESKPQPVQKPISQPFFSSPAPLPKPIDTFKPKIEDVKFRPKLTGPIEEIRSMTLADFRRLAQTPQEIIEKILEKIEIIEEESFLKKTQAIKAWKESVVNQIYLELGDESMEQKRSISEIIAKRQADGVETLTEQEVEAIIELNQRLRY